MNSRSFTLAMAGLRGHIEANHDLEELLQIPGLIEPVSILPQAVEQASEDRLAHVRRADIVAEAIAIPALTHPDANDSLNDRLKVADQFRRCGFVAGSGSLDDFEEVDRWGHGSLRCRGSSESRREPFAEKPEAEAGRQHASLGP